MKVLLIEDHEGFAAIVREMLLSLSQESVSFEWRNRLDKGIERLIQWEPDVILLDLFLPDSRGLDTLSQVRQYAATAPIIVLTGHDDEKLAIEAIGRGAQDYLVKGEIDRRGFGRAIRYAIERKKTELRLEYHRQRQAVLHEINVAITSTLDLPSVLHALLDRVGKLLPKFAVTFWLPTDDQGGWEALACWNLNERDWRPFWTGSASGLVKAVIAAGTPIIIEDVANDPRASNPEMLRRYDLVSYLGVPLRFEGELLGIMGFFSRESGQFNSEEVEFLTTLAGHAAVAIYNSRMYERAQFQAVRLEHANQEIKSTQSKYTELIETINAIVWEADPITWQFTFVSKAAEQILGYPVERWLSTPNFWANYLLHPDDREAAINGCLKHIAAGTDHELEYRAVAADGRTVWLRDNVRVITDETAKAIRLRGVMIDITKSREAEERLQKHSLEIQSLQEVSQKVLNSGDVRDAIEKILDMVMVMGGYDIGSIRLYSSDKGWDHVILRGYQHSESMRAILNHRVARPRDERWRNQARVIATRETLVFEDIEACQGFPIGKREGVRSLILVPIAIKDEVLGVLLIGKRQMTKFQPDQIKLLETLASQIGIVLQKAKLYEEIRAHLTHIQSMRQIEQAMVSTLSLDDVLRVLLDKIESLFSFPVIIAVQLLKPNGSEFDTNACRNIDTDTWRREHERDLPVPQSGLAREVLNSSTPLQILRLEDYPRVRHREFNRRQGLVSYLGISLRVAEQPVGVLSIMTTKEHEFPEHEVNYLASLASHAGIAIHNARLYSELGKKSQELSALFDVTATASQSLEMERILQEVMRKISEIFGFDAMRVCLFDEHREVLHTRAIYQTRPEFATLFRDFEKGQGITGTVGVTGEAIIISNVETDPRYERLSYTKNALKKQQKFIAAFPIKYQDKTLGVISCVGRQPRELAADEIQLITSMSNQVAVAIHNARLYAEIEKKTLELSALFDVTSAASQSLETDQILREVVQKITEIFSFDATRVFLLDETKEELHAQATYETHSDFASETTRIKRGRGISGHAVATGEAIIISDTSTDPRYWELAITKRALKRQQKFMASFPIKYKDETLGAITCVGREPRRLAAHEIQLINSMSSQLAVALENSRYYEQTKKQAMQLRNYALHQESVRELERTRISREIHDELGQALTALKLEVSLLRAKLRTNDPDLDPRIGEISEMLDGTIQTVRKIATQLRPDVLDKLGLIPAIEWHLQEFGKRTGIKSDFVSRPGKIHLSEPQSTAFFRILQEALTNVARHSRASRVRIRLDQKAGQTFLLVEDNGVGIDPEKITAPDSLGLLGMQERARALGGRVNVRRNKRRGTLVTGCIPAKDDRLQNDLSARTGAS